MAAMTVKGTTLALTFGPVSTLPFDMTYNLLIILSHEILGKRKMVASCPVEVSIFFADE